MIDLAILLLLGTVQDPPRGASTDALAEEVVVIGRKLKTWRGDLRSGAKGAACRTRASTGDREIDAIGCAAMLQCWPAVLPRFQAATAKSVAKAESRRLQEEASAAMATCAAEQHRLGVDALARRRAAVDRTDR